MAVNFAALVVKTTFPHYPRFICAAIASQACANIEPRNILDLRYEDIVIEVAIAEAMLRLMAATVEGTV